MVVSDGESSSPGVSDETGGTMCKGGFTLRNAVASNEAIDKGQGRTMLLATRLHATPLACLHYATWLQRRDINLSPGHMGRHSYIAMEA